MARPAQAATVSVSTDVALASAVDKQSLTVEAVGNALGRGVAILFWRRHCTGA